MVTGGAKGIGKAIVEEFGKAGAQICVIDLRLNDGYVGDPAVLEDFARQVIVRYGLTMTVRRTVKGWMPFSSLWVVDNPMDIAHMCFTSVPMRRDLSRVRISALIAA